MDTVRVITCGVPADSRGHVFLGGCVQEAHGVPVTVNYDYEKVVGFAHVRSDGSADVSLRDGVEMAGFDVGLGYRVLKSRVEGDVHIVESIEPITVALMPRPSVK